MCEIQVIKKFGGNLSTVDVQNFFHMLKLGSYANRDAYGFFVEGGYNLRKALAFERESPQIVGAHTTNSLRNNPSFAVGHNRLATQGNKENNYNNHPFVTDNWIVVHNGVLSNDNDLIKTHNLEYKQETDSAVIAHLLQKYTDEKKKPLDAVKNVAEQLTGSFSVVVYNVSTNQLFYFKNASTSFSWGLFTMHTGEKVLVGSTKKKNFDELYASNTMIFYDPLYSKFLSTDAEANVIYEITDKDIKVVERFESAVAKSYYGQQYRGTAYDYENRGSSCATIPSKSDASWSRYGGIYEEDWKNIPKDFRDGKDIEPKSYEDYRELEEVSLNSKVYDSMNTFTEEIINLTGITFFPVPQLSEGTILYEIDEAQGDHIMVIMETIRQYTGIKLIPYRTSGFVVKIDEVVRDYA